MADKTQFLTIPGTSDICLADDTHITKRCLIAGRLDWCGHWLACEPVKKLGPESVALDIGAYVGATTRALLKTGATVHAFEPYADAFACLSNNCPEAVLYNVAVGDGSGVSYGKEIPPGVHANKGGRVMCVGGDMKSLAIDDLQLPRVDFVKIDVEGFEFKVLRGMAETLARCRPAMVIELAEGLLRKMYGMGTQDAIGVLRRWGYAVEIGWGDPVIGADYICTWVGETGKGEGDGRVQNQHAG